MIPEDCLQRMKKTVSNFPELAGGRIVLYGNNVCRELDSGIATSKNYGTVMVVIEEVEVTDTATNLDTQKWSGLTGGSPPGSGNPTVITNKSKFSSEMTGMGISCAMTVVAAGLVLAGGALTIPTGGAAIALFAAGWVGLGASALQCGNAIARVREIQSSPDDDSLEWLDNDTRYKTVGYIVDAIGVATAVAGLPSGIKGLIGLFKTRRVWASRGITEAGLKAMNGADRRIVIDEMVKEAASDPNARKALQDLMRQTASEATLARTTMSVPMAGKLSKSLSADLIKRLHVGMVSAVSGVSGPGFSAMKSEWVGSASGSVNTTGAWIADGMPMQSPKKSLNWIVHLLDDTPAPQ